MLNLKLLETQPGADAAKTADAAAVQLRKDVETLLNDIEDQKLQVAVAQSEKAQLHHEMKSELADRDFAFTNAQQTIAGLEKEVEDLQDEIQQEEVKQEMRRLASVHSKKNGTQLNPIPEQNQENFGNALHFNMDREESPEATKQSMGRPSAQSSEGPAAASSSDPRPASTTFFYPTLHPKDAKIGVEQPDAQTPPETNVKQSDWGNWDPEDNPAVSHGFSSRAEYEDTMAEFTLAARKKAIAARISFSRASAEHPGTTSKQSTGQPTASAPTFEQILPFSQAHVEQGGAITPAFSTYADLV